MVVINMGTITWIMFGLVLLTGNMGFVFLWFFIWMPIGMNLKMEFEFKTFVRNMKEANKLDDVNIEGSIVKVTINSPEPDPLTVGMSMAEP